MAVNLNLVTSTQYGPFKLLTTKVAPEHCQGVDIKQILNKKKYLQIIIICSKEQYMGGKRKRHEVDTD